MYADMEELIRCTRSALVNNGLAVIQPILKEDGQQVIKTILVHADGGQIESVMVIQGYDSIKTFGATITYLRRYAYQAMLNIAADDDIDQAEAQTPSKKPKENTPAPEPSRKTYNDKEFYALLEAWGKMVASGNNTPERILAMVRSKADLTKKQIDAIHALKPETEGETQ